MGLECHGQSLDLDVARFNHASGKSQFIGQRIEVRIGQIHGRFVVPVISMVYDTLRTISRIDVHRHRLASY